MSITCLSVRKSRCHFPGAAIMSVLTRPQIHLCLSRIPDIYSRLVLLPTACRGRFHCPGHLSRGHRHNRILYIHNMSFLEPPHIALLFVTSYSLIPYSVKIISALKHNAEIHPKGQGHIVILPQNHIMRNCLQKQVCQALYKKT